MPLVPRGEAGWRVPWKVAVGAQWVLRVQSPGQRLGWSWLFAHLSGGGLNKESLSPGSRGTSLPPPSGALALSACPSLQASSNLSAGSSVSALRRLCLRCCTSQASQRLRSPGQRPLARSHLGCPPWSPGRRESPFPRGWNKLSLDVHTGISVTDKNVDQGAAPR